MLYSGCRGSTQLAFTALALTSLTCATICIGCSRKSEEVHSVYTFDPDYLSGQWFGNGIGSRAFLEKQQKRHALLLTDLEGTRSLTLIGAEGQLELMFWPLKKRKFELESMLAKLPGANWPDREREEVRAVLSEELKWVAESIDGINSLK